MPRLVACLAAIAASACLAGAMDSPVEPKDKTQPIEVIGGGEWSAEEIAKKGRTAEGLLVATFHPDKARGPATLLVDLEGSKPDPKVDVAAGVSVHLLCWSKPDACTSLADQLRMSFHGDYMAHGETETPAGKKVAVAAGREFRRYTFGPGVGEVRLRISVGDTVNFTPQRLRARLFYGEHDGKPLQGQGTRMGRLLWIVLGGAVVLVAAFAWLRRR